jgi:hypothetical protein
MQSALARARQRRRQQCRLSSLLVGCGATVHTLCGVECWTPDVIFTFDLPLPADFVTIQPRRRFEYHFFAQNATLTVATMSGIVLCCLFSHTALPMSEVDTF